MKSEKITLADTAVEMQDTDIENLYIIRTDAGIDVEQARVLGNELKSMYPDKEFIVSANSASITIRKARMEESEIDGYFDYLQDDTYVSLDGDFTPDQLRYLADRKDSLEMVKEQGK